MHQIDDFILPVTTRLASRTSLKETDSAAHPVGDSSAPQFTTLTEQYETPERLDDQSTEIQTVDSQDSSILSSIITENADLGHLTEEVTDEPTDNDIVTNSGDDETLVVFPTISPADYEIDAEFADIYTYLRTEELTGDARKDRTTLLLSDRFAIEEGLLYRMDTPRQKRLARLKPVVKRLCVSKRFRHDIMRFVHDNCGHYSVENLFHTLAARYYWKALFSDASEFCRTCAVCKRTKVNFSHRYAPLHPVPVPDELGLCFAMDHKILTRKTEAGNTAVLVIVECFQAIPI